MPANTWIVTLLFPLSRCSHPDNEKRRKSVINVIKAIDPIEVHLRFDKKWVTTMPCFLFEFFEFLCTCNFNRFRVIHIEGNGINDSDNQLSTFDTPVIIEKLRMSFIRTLKLGRMKLEWNCLIDLLQGLPGLVFLSFDNVFMRISDDDREHFYFENWTLRELHYSLNDDIMKYKDIVTEFFLRIMECKIVNQATIKTKGQLSGFEYNKKIKENWMFIESFFDVDEEKDNDDEDDDLLVQ